MSDPKPDFPEINEKTPAVTKDTKEKTDENKTKETTTFPLWINILKDKCKRFLRADKIDKFIKELRKIIEKKNNHSQDIIELLELLKVRLNENDENVKKLKKKDIEDKIIKCPTDTDRTTLLHLAAIHYHDDKNLGVLKLLMEIFPDLVRQERQGKYLGQTALHIVVLKGNVEGVKAILEFAKAVDERKKDQKNEKKDDKQKSEPSLKETLLKTKATGKLFEKTKMMGETPLSIAALTFKKEMIDVLLENGANLDEGNSLGDTVFHTLVRFAAFYPEEQRDVTIIMEYLKTKVKIYYHQDSMDLWRKENNEGLTVLQLTALLGQPELFKWILTKVYLKMDNQDGLFDCVSYDVTEIDFVALHHLRHWMKPDESSFHLDKILNKTTRSSQRVNKIGCFHSCKAKNCFKTSKTGPSQSTDDNSDENVSSSSEINRKLRSPSVLEIACETKKIEKAFQLINMPLVDIIIKKKWKGYKVFFFAWLCLHLCIMGLLAAHAVFKAQLIINLEPPLSTTPASSLFNSTAATVSSLRSDVVKETFVFSSTIILFVLALMILVLEFVRIYRRQPFCLFLIQHNGFYRFELIVFSLSLMVDSLWYWITGPDNNYFLTLALVVGCWFLTFFLRPFKKFSFFTVMLRKVLLGDILRFSTIVVLELAAFSFAMYITYLPTPGGPPAEFEHLGVTGMTMFKLMLGLIDLDILYDAPHNWMSVIIFIAFVLLTYILMLNALIAMMSNTCSMVSSDKKMQWKLQRLSVVIMIETMIPLSFACNTADSNLKGRSYLKVSLLKNKTLDHESRDEQCHCGGRKEKTSETQQEQSSKKKSTGKADFDKGSANGENSISLDDNIKKSAAQETVTPTQLS